MQKLYPAGTYRSIFKWGAADQFKHPNHGLVKYMRRALDMGEGEPHMVKEMGLDPVEVDLPSNLDTTDRSFFESIVGCENIHSDAYTRIKKSYGAGMIDALRLRKMIVENIPAIVISPRTKTELAAIVRILFEKAYPDLHFWRRIVRNPRHGSCKRWNHAGHEHPPEQGSLLQ